MNKTRPMHFSLPPASGILRPQRAFTLVELLVVITIIGILASLITVAAVGALKTAQQTRIKAELIEISDGYEEYKNKFTAYPPNCQTDDTNAGPSEPTNTPLAEAQILNDLKRHLKQVAPKHREPESLLKALVGLAGQTVDHQLEGGMTAGEAIVFWLGGFSSDPKFPISGEGGPSYPVVHDELGINIPSGDRRKADPIESRRWVFPFQVARLAPRNSTDDYFDENDGRYIEYVVTIPGQNNNAPQTRRINFWQYVPAKSTQPYFYFDTSRHPAYDSTDNVQPARFDPPAATALTGVETHVHAFKKLSDSAGATAQIQFVDPDKFQVIHCGVDDAWDTSDFSNFERMSVHDVASTDPNDYLLFPVGPFIGEIADTAVNFTTEGKIEDAQPQ